MPRAQAIRWTVEVASKVFHCADVGTCGIVSVITTLEFLQHHFSESGHKDLLMTRKFILRAWQSPIRSPHAKRLPPGGYVQTRKPDILALAARGIRSSANLRSSPGAGL